MKSEYEYKVFNSKKMKALKKAFHPSVGENRSQRRKGETKDKPGKMYIIGTRKYTTYLQIIDGKKILHYR